eukprot:9101096-Heterocapsa_arctica.AAC.1
MPIGWRATGRDSSTALALPYAKGPVFRARRGLVLIGEELAVLSQHVDVTQDSAVGAVDLGWSGPAAGAA